MNPRLLMIVLATILLSSILLFIYFKTRIGNLERKLEIVFNLVQSHAKENSMQNNLNIPQQQFIPRDMFEESNRVNLIDVSDDENTDDDSDSEENETDDDDQISIQNNVDSEEIKKIALTLEGNDNDLDIAEEIIVQKGMFQLSDNNISSVIAEHMKSNTANDYNDDNDDNDDNDEDEDEDNDDNDEDEDDDNDEDDNDDNDDDEDDDEDDDDDIEEKKDNNQNLFSLKVPQLKELCKSNGFKGYKKLKKAELINLLQN